MTLSVGGLTLANPLMLSPLAGITVLAVRRLFWRLGVGLAHTEMVSCAGLIRDNGKTEKMLLRGPMEGPLVLQLFAGDRDTLMRGAERALAMAPHFQALGINMACPMPKVIKKGAGAKLLERPEVAADMVRGLKSFGLPVWPKIRKIPPQAGRRSTLQFAGSLIEAGADNVGIHGRTAGERYGGRSDLEEVLKVARVFPSMISASGDMTDVSSIKKALDGGCVSVFLARGAVADPFLVPRVLGDLGYNSGNCPERPSPTIEERAGLLAALAEDLAVFHGEKAAMVLLKRFLSGIFRGVPGCGPYKRAVADASDWQEVQGLVKDPWRYFREGLRDEREGAGRPYARGGNLPPEA